MDRFHEKCRRLAARVISVPPINTPDGGSSLATQLRQLRRNGFVIVAIDNKTRESFQYAMQFLQRTFTHRRSLRQADIVQSFDRLQPQYETLPWDEWIQLSEAERDSRTRFFAQNGVWVVARVDAIGKRLKGKEGAIVEERIFEFRALCRELEQFDSTGEQSKKGLMRRLRLKSI